LTFEFIVWARETECNGLMVYAFGYLKHRRADIALLVRENMIECVSISTPMELESKERAPKNRPMGSPGDHPDRR
jgi:hypothetical protein